MRKEPSKVQPAPMGILFGVLLGSAVLTLLISSFDPFESLWTFTRSYEVWELDDMLLAFALASMLGLVVALIRLNEIQRRLAELEAGGPPPVAREKVSVKMPGLETIVRCTTCQKFKSEEDLWQTEEDYISHRCNATIVAGVCPSCRSSGGK